MKFFRKRFKLKQYQVSSGLKDEEKLWILSVPLGNGTEIRGIPLITSAGKPRQWKFNKYQMHVLDSLIDKIIYHFTEYGKKSS